MTLNRIFNVLHHIAVNPIILTNALKVIQQEGIHEFMLRSLQLFHGTRSYSYTPPLLSPEIEVVINEFSSKPLISIIMPVYNVDPLYLEAAINSVRGQWYRQWELCITDDASTNKETIKYLKSIQDKNIIITFSEKNENISTASNRAIATAKGDYVALLDNDDTLTPDAPYEVVKSINETDADFIYSDEDFITKQGKSVHAHFKPDFSPDLLLSHNYITHFSVLKRELIERIGEFHSEFDGAQDYDLFLRATEETNRIHHIPKVLYHWRMLESSTSSNTDAKPEASNRGQNALISALNRRHIDAEVLDANLPNYFRVQRSIIGNPLVSIIIPFKDMPELLYQCIDSILRKSTYRNFEIIGVSNNSESPETYQLMKQLKNRDNRIDFHEYNKPFNYSEINNYAVQHFAKGEHILLLNNDIEIITPEWIEALLEHSQRSEVGCVGAKLYYEDDTVQHAGAIIGLGGYVAHSHRQSPRKAHGYFNRLNVIQNLSAVTGACLMVKKSIYEAVKGLDEIHFKIAYNDIDFCLRVREEGYLNLFTPYCEAYHYESKTRGNDDEDTLKKERFQQEKDYLKDHHSIVKRELDPYYNPNLTLADENFSLK